MCLRTEIHRAVQFRQAQRKELDDRLKAKIKMRAWKSKRRRPLNKHLHNHNGLSQNSCNSNTRFSFVSVCGPYMVGVGLLTGSGKNIFQTFYLYNFHSFILSKTTKNFHWQSSWSQKERANKDKQSAVKSTYCQVVLSPCVRASLRKTQKMDERILFFFLHYRKN